MECSTKYFHSSHDHITMTAFAHIHWNTVQASNSTVGFGTASFLGPAALLEHLAFFSNAAMVYLGCVINPIRVFEKASRTAFELGRIGNQDIA